MRMLGWQVAISIAALCGTAEAGWSRVSEDRISLDGYIGKESYHDFLSVAEGGYREVVVNSAGGYPSVTLLIAEHVRQSGATVVVDGVCMSACANYIAAAGSRLVIECGSVLAWHGGLQSVAQAKMAMAASGVPSPVIDAYASWLSEFKNREAAFFRATGVDMSILGDSVAAVETAGITPAVTFEIDDVTGEYSYTTSAAFWVPARSDLESYGFNAEFSCSAYSDADISRYLARAGIGAPFTTLSRSRLSP